MARRSRAPKLAVALVAAVLVLSFGTGRTDVRVTTTPAATEVAAVATSAPAATTNAPGPDPLLGSGSAVTLAFAGDTNFEDAMGPRLRSDPSTAIGPFTSILVAADLAIGNLESSVGTHGTPEPGKQYTFQAPPEAVDAMRAGGFDVVSVANNHGRDYGPEGLADTLAVKAAQPDGLLIGAGSDDAEAYAPYRTTIKGQRIAVIAATQVIDNELVTAWSAGPSHPGLASAKDSARLVQAVRAARATSDTVVVFLHWGVELDTCPSGAQQTLAKSLADAGADIVVGGHAHRLQGAGMLGPTFVGYGLGNFDFYATGAGRQTGVIQVTVTGHRVDGYTFVPGRIDGGVATPLEGTEADAAVAAWNAQRDCTGLAG